jgi:hypothetical protein
MGGDAGMSALRRAVLTAIVALAIVGTGVLLAYAQDLPKAPVVPDQPAARAKRDGDREAAQERKAEKQRVREQLAAENAARQRVAAPPAIAVGGDYVYVVRGNMLYQFSVNGLKLVAKTQIETPSPEKLARREALKRRAAEPVATGAKP